MQNTSEMKKEQNQRLGKQNSKTYKQNMMQKSRFLKMKRITFLVGEQLKQKRQSKKPR